MDHYPCSIEVTSYDGEYSNAVLEFWTSSQVAPKLTLANVISVVTANTE